MTALYRWLNDRWYRWRTVHPILGALLTIPYWWLGLYTFLIHEGSQAPTWYRWERKNYLDFATAALGVGIIVIWKLT